MTYYMIEKQCSLPGAPAHWYNVESGLWSSDHKQCTKFWHKGEALACMAITHARMKFVTPTSVTEHIDL